VNLRVDLSRAPQEVALLPKLRSSIRTDGRGEDDVVMAGLFQADDAYLLKRTMGQGTLAAVRSKPTDLYSRHQTSNILIDEQRTSEFIGRGGPVDFLRLFNLELAEAELVSHHLPVFADFAAREGS
ncbi:MAG: deoxyribonuclease I, partial [Planctomycetota bacterium]